MKKPALIAAVIIMVAVLVTVIIMLNKDGKAASMTVADGMLHIKCTFGVDVPVSGIRELALTETMPAILRKTNGAGVGTSYKGEFTLENNVNARLYADAGSPPFISFTQNGTVFYLNAGTPEETRALFEQLKAAAGG